MMPQPLQYLDQEFNDFVTLSQLVSTPPAAACRDPIEQWRTHPVNSLLLKTSISNVQDRSHYSGKSSDMSQQSALPVFTHHISPYNSSSPSESPSPKEGTFFGVQQEQHEKRRAQNRAAQRAYRDRKMRHLVDLEKGIREIEQKIRRLQTENTDLIRELCDIRAENRGWKEGRARANSSVPASSNPQDGRTQAVELFTTPIRCPSRPDNDMAPSPDTASNDSELLYGPFAAMWNLIQLDPSVVNGNVSAVAVLERLRQMVESEMAAEQRRSSLQSISESNERTNAVDRPNGGG